VTFTNASIPNAGAPNNHLAVLWDDFDLTPARGIGTIHTEVRGDPGSQRFIISWENVGQYNAANPTVDFNSFQIVLFEDGRIEYRYGSINSDFSTINNDTSATNGGATVGFEDQTGSGASSQYAMGSQPVVADSNLALTAIDNNPCEDAPPCAADFNGDGILNPDDLSEFITCFFLQLQFPGFCPQGDFNQDGLLNPDDLSEFITTFFLSLQFGC
jgi:hypothetical protein